MDDKIKKASTGSKNTSAIEGKPKAKYGIVIYTTEEGLHEMELINKEQCSLNELLGLIEIAKREITAVWDTKNDPTTSTVLRRLDNIEKIADNQTKVISSLYEALKGIKEVILLDKQVTDDSSDFSNTGDIVNASTPQEQIQTK